ncbi:MAG: nuclear transport factor 2 [Frankiales bacterium]|nr:nuclear transport factor 2 [Frankiales bacterium]
MTDQSSSNTLSADDRFAISDLYYNYSFAIDDGDTQRLGSLFTEDASFELPGSEPIVGRAAMIALGEGAAKNGPGIRHILSGVVAAAAPFGATGRAYVQAFKYEESAVRLLAFGEYVDDLVHGPDGWRFQTRRFHVLSPPALSGLVLAEATVSV